MLNVTSPSRQAVQNANPAQPATPWGIGDWLTRKANDVYSGVTDAFDATTDALGFRGPQTQGLERDKEGYRALGDMAKDRLGGAYSAPSMQLPGFRQASVMPAYASTLSTDEAEWRARQKGLADTLGATAQGLGPSVAQEQLRRATEANLAGQLAMANSSNGLAQLAAQRRAMWNAAQANQSAAGQAAELRAQEIAGAQNSLSNLLAGARAADINVAGQNAGLSQQVELANVGAHNVANNNYADAMNRGLLTVGQSNLNSALDTNRLNSGRDAAYMDALLGIQGAVTGIDTNIMTGQSAYDAGKRKMTGDALNAAGGYYGFTKAVK